MDHIGAVAHFVDVGVTRNVKLKGCQKLQSGRPTYFVDQHICWCGWCSVTVQFVVAVLLNDTICWCGDVFRINILRKRPILLVYLKNIHNGYAFRINILCLQNQHSVPAESTNWSLFSTASGTLVVSGVRDICIMYVVSPEIGSKGVFKTVQRRRPDQTKLWQSVAVCGSLWQSVADCGSLWQSLPNWVRSTFGARLSL